MEKYAVMRKISYRKEKELSDILCGLLHQSSV